MASDNHNWSTADEINYLESVVRRDGRIDHNCRAFSAAKTLENWLNTCERREWPVGFHLEAARGACLRLLSRVKTQRAAA